MQVRESRSTARRVTLVQRRVGNRAEGTSVRSLPSRHRLLIALAAAAALAGLGTARQWSDYRQRAESHALLAEGGLVVSPEGNLVERLTAEQRDYHRRLWRKYERAARSPWLPVGVDPAAPEVTPIDELAASGAIPATIRPPQPGAGRLPASAAVRPTANP